MISNIMNRTLFNTLYRFNSLASTLAFNTQSNFCTYTHNRYESHPLRNKIMDLTNLEEFHNFFKDKQQEFDNSCYSIASKTLARILIEARLNYNLYQKDIIKQYLNQLEKINIDSLSLNQFSQLLFLLRTIKLDQNNNNSWVSGFIKNILEKSEKKIKQIQQESPLNKLVYFYQQFSGLNSKHSYVIAKRINELIKKSQPQVEQVTLTISQMIILCKGMKNRTQFNHEQLFLLKAIINLVNQKYTQNISFLQLVQLSCNINQIVSGNPNDIIPLKDVDEIHRRVHTNIEDMDQKSIMFILNSKKTGNKIYNQIYKIIFQKIFDQIQPNGESSFNQLFTFKLFNGISNKFRLSTTNQQNQNKFFAFVSSVTAKTPRYVNSFIQNYIMNGFFNYNQLKRLVEMLQNVAGDVIFKLSLLAELGRRRMDIEKLVHIDEANLPEVKDKNLIYIGLIYDSMTEKKSEKQQIYISILNKYKERFLTLYNLEDQSFLKFIFSLDSKLFHPLMKVFRKQIQSKFPNPFEGNAQHSAKYRNAYLKLLVLGSNDIVFAKKQSFTLSSSIKKQELQFILKYMINCRNDLKEFYPNIFNLLAKKIDLILSDSNLLYLVERFLTSQLLSIFEQNSNDIPKQKFWYILNEAQQKMSEKAFISTFSNVIHILLRSNIYNFSYSEQYQAILKKLLKNLDVLNKYLSNSIVKECLKLNIIKRETLQFITVKARQNLYKEDKLLLSMIEKNQFLLANVQLARNNLYLYLFNLSNETKQFLKNNTQKITSLIGQMKPKEILKCILHYRIGNGKNELLILEGLFKQLNTNNYLQYEEFCPMIVADVLRRNNIQRTVNFTESVKVFLKNTLQYFSQKSKIHKLTLEQHINLIKASNDFRIKNDEYIHTLMERFSQDNTIFYRELFLVVGQLGLELDQNQIKKLQSKNLFVYFTSSFSKSFHLFLLFESKLSNPKLCLSNIIKKYKQLDENQKVSLFSIYYQYLKSVYPQQTKDFMPNNIVNADLCKNIQALNNNSIVLLRQLFEDVSGDKWVENLVHSNYYYVFRNINFLFPSVSKYNGENTMIKKLLRRLSGVEKFLIINKNQTSIYNIIKFIKTNHPDILTAEYEEKLLKRLQELKKNKNQAVSEQTIQQIRQDKNQNELSKQSN